MPAFVIGDIHGHTGRVLELLREVGLIGSDLEWTGWDSVLWFVGDFCDRGPDGIGAIDLFMRLQPQAAASGGRVEALLGNHDALLLAAERFGYQRINSPSGTFIADWKRNGGVDSDLARLKPHHIRWLSGLPAMRLDGERLFVHADAWFYVHYGHTVEAVNQAFAVVLRGSDPAAWDRLLDDFSEHRAFVREDGIRKARRFLSIFGGRQIVHGHTPISKITAQSPESVVDPLVYASNCCINVDGGLYLGGKGFIYELPPL